jgi:ribulose 1,5-bisphosphate carboxylase large subunit-like protein
MIERRTFSGGGIRYIASAAAAAAANDNNDNRGGTAPPTLSFAATSWETTSMTTVMMTMTTTTTIALPATIESTGAAVLMPHLAHRGFDVVIFTELSCAICIHANAHGFERHQRANVHAFVLGQRWRDDGSDSIVFGDSGGDVHHDSRGTNDGDGDGNGNSNADDILY